MKLLYFDSSSSDEIPSTSSTTENLQLEPSSAAKSDGEYVKRIQLEEEFLKLCLKELLIDDWFQSDAKGFTLNELSADSSIFETVSLKFSNSHPLVPKRFKITRIQEVINPFLKLQYELTKSKLQTSSGYIGEIDLFHGTCQEKLSSICQNNFDWRLKG